MVVRASNLFYGYSACSYIASKVKSGYIADNEGQQVSSNGHDRALSFNDCMAKLDPKVHVLSKDTLWNPNTALTFTETAIDAYHSQVKAVYDEYSGPDPGIIKFLQAKGYGPAGGTKPHVILGGDDGVAYEQCYISQGWMDFASSQPANLYSLGAIEYAVDAARGVTLNGRDARFDRRSSGRRQLQGRRPADRPDHRPLRHQDAADVERARNRRAASQLHDHASH